MVQDHMPDTVLEVLGKVSRDELFICINYEIKINIEPLSIIKLNISVNSYKLQLYY